METEFERRLREILNEYPDADPGWAALALKGQPEATNEQIVQLSKFSAPKEAERGTSKPSKQTVIEPDLARALEKGFNEKWPHLADRQPEKVPSMEVAMTPTWSDGAEALKKARDWPGLLAHCRQWTRAEADTVAAWYALGVAYANLGRHQDAIEAYREAVRLKPDYAVAWFNLGFTYRKLFRYPEAIEAYREAVRLKPDLVNAWYFLALAYADSGNRSAALEAVQQVQRLEPQEADDLLNLIKERAKKDEGEKPTSEEIQSDVQQEKTVVVFRKISDGRITALLSEIPYDDNNLELSAGYEYIDEYTPIEYLSFLQNMDHAGLLDEQEKAELSDLNNLCEINLTRHELAFQNIDTEESYDEPEDKIIIINSVQNIQKEPSKKDFMKIAFQGFVIIVVGIIGLLFALIMVPGPIVIISIIWGIIVGFIGLCHFVGKWFSSKK